MVTRAFRKGESTLRYLAQQVVDLCAEIDDESLEPGIEALQQALARMARYRRVLFFGGAGCGRAALVAGVAGFPAVAQVAWSGPYRSWRYISSLGEDSNARYIPVPDLEGLELTDTPDCEQEAVQESVAALAESADVTVAVVDARAAEQSPCWKLLSHLPSESGRCLVAVTGAGALSAEDALALKEQLRSGFGQAAGVSLTVCFVNPAVPHEMEVFCGRVQEALKGAGGMRRDLQSVYDAVKKLLDMQGAVLTRREAVLRTDNGFLDKVEREFDSFRSHQEEGVSMRVQGLFNQARALLPVLQVRFRRAFGLLYSPVTLLRLSLFGKGIEKCYARMLEDMLRKNQAESDAVFAHSCASHWNRVRPEMKKVLECEPGDFPEQKLNRELAKLREVYAAEASRFLSASGLGATLAQDFAACRDWMHGVLVLGCVLLSLAGMLGIFRQIDAACLLMGISVLVWGLAGLRHWWDRRRLLRRMEQLVDGLQAPFQAHLLQAVHALVISRVAAYRSLYNEPRLKVAANAEKLKPIQNRFRALGCSVRRSDLFV